MNAHPTDSDLSSRPRHECGICGVFGHQDAAKLVYFGLYALQHRGQESAGIVAGDGRQVAIHKEMGLVADVFNERTLQKLSGHLATGHVRYSTTGESTLINTQPFLATHKGMSLSVAHNGNLVNSMALRRHLEQQGSIFQTAMDSEIVIHLMARHLDRGLQEAIKTTFSCIQGAYSLLLMTQDTMIAVRDPNGFRPLCLGRLEGGWVMASESPALDVVGAHFVREVEPGEMVIIDESGVTSRRPFPESRLNPSLCIFEFVYFARPDTRLYGQSVHHARVRQGELLAEQAPVEADMVMGVPESGLPTAEGYARTSGIPYGQGLMKNRYIGRTFIAPTQELRAQAVRMKLNPLRENLAGKRVVVVDDSVVRGTTQKQLVRMLREAGVTEVHLRLTSPPVKWSCFYGIDTGRRSELLAANLTVEEIRDYLDVDTLAFITLDRLVASTGTSRAGFCDACFTGEYPVPVPVSLTKGVLEPAPEAPVGAGSPVATGFFASDLLPADDARRGA